MITKLFFSSILTFLIGSGLMVNNNNATVDAPQMENNQTTDVVKAIMFNGEVIPMIELPVVEITGKLNTESMMRATVYNGEVMPMIELNEIVITPNS